MYQGAFERFLSSLCQSLIPTTLSPKVGSTISGAVEVCWAHKSEVNESKLSSLLHENVFGEFSHHGATSPFSSSLQKCRVH